MIFVKIILDLLCRISFFLMGGEEELFFFVDSIWFCMFVFNNLFVTSVPVCGRPTGFQPCASYIVWRLVAVCFSMSDM